MTNKSDTEPTSAVADDGKTEEKKENKVSQNSCTPGKYVWVMFVPGF